MMEVTEEEEVDLEVVLAVDLVEAMMITTEAMVVVAASAVALAEVLEEATEVEYPIQLL